MNDATTAGFPCDQCGRRFKWVAALAGRRVRCPCGNVLRCPDAAADNSELYDLAPEAPTGREPAAAVDPSAPAPVAPAPRTLGYRAPKDEARAPDHDPVKDLYMPLWLLGGGTLIEIIAAFFI